MAIKELKRYIFENNKIEFVLENIGNHHIKYHPNKEFYSCANNDGDNVSAVNVYNNEYLNVRNWTRSNDFDDYADIITLTQYNRKCSFIEAVKYLHSILGLEHSPRKMAKKKDEKKDPLWIFKRIKSARRADDEQIIQTIKESELNDFMPILHIDWLREGIAPWTAKKFGLCYSYKRKRVIVPIRYWLTGELVGINARTTIENYEELGIKKYMITPSYQKSLNLYGLWENYDSIQEAGYVILYESEKSVLKMCSRDGHESEDWKYGFNGKTGVALSGKTLSDEQVKILIGLNVEIIMAFDKDVDINEIRHACDKFYKIRKVSYMYDKWGLLENKQSPADVSNKKFDFLFKWRTPYNESEHNEHIKSLTKETK